VAIPNAEKKSGRVRALNDAGLVGIQPHPRVRKVRNRSASASASTRARLVTGAIGSSRALQYNGHRRRREHGLAPVQRGQAGEVLVSEATFGKVGECGVGPPGLGC